MNAYNRARALGGPLDTFITIRWALTGKGEAKIQFRWQCLLNAFRIWAKRHGFKLAHVWVHENPHYGSFNTHVLANIPANRRQELQAWIEAQLNAQFGGVDVQPRVASGWYRDDRVRYMVKGTDWVTAKKFRLMTPKGWDCRQGPIDFKRCGWSNTER
ncbi:MAG: hypothetical protein U1E46_16955 [Hyphomicrobiales bacterium]